MPTPSDRAHTPPHAGGEQEPRKPRNWSGVVDELIQEAQREGAFTNLRGTGQPLRLEDNVYAGDRALAYSLLHSNHAAPPEIERGNEIDAELERAEALLATLRRHCDDLRVRGGHAFASERRAYSLLRERTATRYAEALRTIKSKILSLNIIAPAPLHRRVLDVEAKLWAFNDEFPRLKE
ncbi:MAG: DUF1992 domain-containing protein [Ktedonobacterales bacterium]|nr:DUF1992 domain-containing protein [Ktedonobacterales bacterium]